MPKTFAQITGDRGGEVLFFSDQSTITSFLGGPFITNFEGMCLALVMLWLSQDTSKTDPAKGIKNKTAALSLQNTMETNWKGFPTAVETAKTRIGKQFWYSSDQKHEFTSKKYGAEHFLQADPKPWKESRNIFVIYFPKGPAHALGVWRFEKAIVLYDPNHGACVIGKDGFREFLNEFLTELYGDTDGYAICAFVSN